MRLSPTFPDGLGNKSWGFTHAETRGIWNTAYSVEGNAMWEKEGEKKNNTCQSLHPSAQPRGFPYVSFNTRNRSPGESTPIQTPCFDWPVGGEASYVHSNTYPGLSTHGNAGISDGCTQANKNSNGRVVAGVRGNNIKH